MKYSLSLVDSAALGKVFFAAVWDESGWHSLIFPEKNKASVVKRVLARYPQAKLCPLARAPAVIRKETELVAKYLDGKKADLTKVRLNLESVPPFHRKVYEQALLIPRGKLSSYAELSKSLGQPSAARAVGQAMARNPLPLIVPCHRVLAASRELGGFTAPGGLDSKMKLLKMEGYKEPTLRKFPGGVKPEQELTKLCKRMAKLINEIGAYNRAKSGHGTVYEALFRSIIFQQLNGRAAQTILDRVKAKFGGNVPTPKQLLSTKLGDLREAGVSGNKELALRDLAQKKLDGLIPAEDEIKKLDDEEIIERLVQIRGVGRWTVEMILIFHLNRPDVWPVDDFAIRAATGRLFGLTGLPKSKEIQALADRWRPFRSVATWYLYRSQDLHSAK